MKHSFDSFDQILIFQNFCFHPSVEFVLLFPHWEDLCICVHVCISDIWVNGVCHQETSGWQDQPSRRDRPRLPPSFLGRQAGSPAHHLWHRQRHWGWWKFTSFCTWNLLTNVTFCAGDCIGGARCLATWRHLCCCCLCCYDWTFCHTSDICMVSLHCEFCCEQPDYMML